MEDNIIDILFDAKEDDDLFNLNDKVLVSLDNQLENTDFDISKFIEKNIHPRNRYKLKKLLNRKEHKIYEYLRRENQLFYKNGISDGIKIILISMGLK